MGDKSYWPKIDPGFKMIPPKLERPPGRPRKKRIKASGEAGKRGTYQCKRCFQFEHIEKGCNATQAELEQELPPPCPKTAKKSKGNTRCLIHIHSYVMQYFLCLTHGVAHRKSKFDAVEVVDAEPSQNTVDPKVMSSLGVITRSMSSLSPTSPGPTIRRMASISPGGINRMLIIN